MRKVITLVMAALFVFAAGCAQKTNGLNVDAAAAADKLASSVKFSDQMTAVEEKTALKLYGLDPGAVAGVKAYESSGATAEEIAVFEAKDDASAGKVREAAQKRIENQKSAFQDYQPKEMAKLKDPVLVTTGRFVVLCVSNDNSTARNTINGMMK